MGTNSCDYPQPRQVRRIRPTRRSVSGRFAFRGATSIAFESTLERDFLLRLEFFRNVTEVIAQPVQVRFSYADGRVYNYTPDYLVYRSDAPPELVEVKPATDWQQHWRRWSPKWKAARRLARGRGWTFRLHDESRIRDRTLENIRFLQRYRRMHYPPDASARIVDAVAAAGTVRLGALIDTFLPADDTSSAAAQVWHLVANRRLDCDMTRALNGATELTVPT